MIKVLTGENFDSVVYQPDKHAFIFISKPGCSQCAVWTDYLTHFVLDTFVLFDLNTFEIIVYIRIQCGDDGCKYVSDRHQECVWGALGACCS